MILIAVAQDIVLGLQCTSADVSVVWCQKQDRKCIIVFVSSPEVSM